MKQPAFGLAFLCVRGRGAVQPNRRQAGPHKNSFTPPILVGAGLPAIGRAAAQDIEEKEIFGRLASFQAAL